MLNEQYYEQDWVAHAPVARPYMETNRWLTNVCSTRAVGVAAPETQTIEVLGLKLVWTKDGGRKFPAAIIDVFQRLVDFSTLPIGWNSYSTSPLHVAAGQSVVRLVLRAHQFAKLPRMHPLADGGVGLVWEGDRELELLVSHDGTLEGLLTVGDDEIELPPGASLTSGMELLERYLTAR